MTDVMPEQLVDLDELTGGETRPANTTGLDAVDEQLIAQLAGRARAGGLALAGEGGLLAQLTKRLVESALEGELTDHLGYGRHDATGRDGGNSRNGHRAKTVLTEVGPVEIDVPRDRDATFEPKIVAKRQRRLSGVDELVISLSAKGLTTGEVQAHLAEVYGAQVSRQTISTITDKVVDAMAEWQNRPLDPVYPVIFIDAINVKIRDGKVANRPIYVALTPPPNARARPTQHSYDSPALGCPRRRSRTPPRRGHGPRTLFAQTLRKATAVRRRAFLAAAMISP